MDDPKNLHVIVEPISPIKLDHKKFLVNRDTTIGQFIYKLRQRMTLKQEEALFMHVKGKNGEEAISISQLMSQVHHEYKNEQGILVFVLRSEEVFGSFKLYEQFEK